MSRSKKRFFNNCKNIVSDLEKVTNLLMVSGKKYKSREILAKSISTLEKKIPTSSFDLKRDIVNNVMVSFMIKKKKIGGLNYQIPVEIDSNRSFSTAIKSIIRNARSRSDTGGISLKFYLELLDIYLMKGKTVKEKEEKQKIFNTNKIFSHHKL